MNKIGKSQKYGIGGAVNMAAKVACVGLASFCFGADKVKEGTVLGEWVSKTGGFYDDKQNWSGEFVPAKDERALFDMDRRYEVKFRENAENSRLVVNKGRVLFDMQGNSYFLNGGSGSSHEGGIEVGEYSGDDGELSINDGILEGYLINIGVDKDATGKVVVGKGGELKNQMHGLFVGNYGRGELEVIKGGRVSSAAGIIGTYAGSFGEVIVKGKNSIWRNQEDLAIGYSRDAAGRLEIEAGGRVENAGSVFVGGSFDYQDGIGELIVKDGSLEARDIKIYERGTLFVKKGDVLANEVNSNGIIYGAGEIKSDVRNEGVVNPGIEIGILDVGKGYVQGEGGILCIELNNDCSDLLRVAGKAVLGGGLEIKVKDGRIENGKSYKIMNYAEREGEFEKVNWDSSKGEFEVIYGKNGIFLKYSKK